jgi:transcriptional regulator with XRE-family HTH domain
VTTVTAIGHEHQAVGELLRFWRRRRRLSQLDLSLEASVSTKHLSFVETGRARPSRQLLVHLAERLQIPLRERNRLMLAAGFAPHYRELAFDDGALRPLHEALENMLDMHQPNPALVVDAQWQLVAHNAAANLLWDGVAPELLEPPMNILRLACHPAGLPSISTMTPICSRGLLDRVRRQACDDADVPLLDLVAEMDGYLSDADHGLTAGWTGDGATAGFSLRTRLGEVRLFTIIATLGSPLEVSAGSLAIETFLPADAESGERLHRLAELAAALT